MSELGNLSEILDGWREGLLGPHEALRSLCSDLAEIDSELQPLTQEREAYRAALSEIVFQLGGKADVAGFGELRITEPAKTASYDRKALDELVLQLVQAGMTDVASAITNCRKESARTGSLQIRRST